MAQTGGGIDEKDLRTLVLYRPRKAYWKDEQAIKGGWRDKEEDYELSKI